MYEYAIKLKPNYPETHNNLGMVYEKKSSYQQAIKHFKRAIEIKPAFPEPYFNLGNLYLGKLNEKRNALFYFKKWLEKAPRHPASDRVREIIRKLEKEGVE